MNFITTAQSISLNCIYQLYYYYYNYYYNILLYYYNKILPRLVNAIWK